MVRGKAPVALITGAARGIGRAIAQRLLDDGFRVGAVDLPGSGLKRGYAGESRHPTDTGRVAGQVRAK